MTNKRQTRDRNVRWCVETRGHDANQRYSLSTRGTSWAVLLLLLTRGGWWGWWILLKGVGKEKKTFLIPVEQHQNWRQTWKWTQNKIDEKEFSSKGSNLGYWNGKSIDEHYFFLFIFLYQLFPVISHTYAQIFLSLSRLISEFFSTFHKITRFRSDSDIFIRTLLYDVHLLLSLTVLSIFFYINLLLTINSVDELELSCVVLFLNFRVYPSRGLFW